MIYQTRSDWRAHQPRRAFHTIRPTKILFLHHAAGYQWGGALAVREIQALHQDDRGWKDIAYNWLVDAAGTIFEGRGWFKAGGATKGWNTWSHSICYIGNAEQVHPTQAALSSIAAVGAEAERLMGPQSWRPHNSAASTLCPGKHLIAWLNDGRPTQEDEMAAEWQEKVAFVLGVEQAYRHTGPNTREPTPAEVNYWGERYDNGDDPTWLLAALRDGLSKEAPRS